MSFPIVRRLATTLAGAAVGAALLLWAFPVRGEKAQQVISPTRGEISGGAIARPFAAPGAAR